MRQKSIAVLMWCFLFLALISAFAAAIYGTVLFVNPQYTINDVLKMVME